MSYPMEHGLDGIFLRVQRDDEWCNVCFSDLTPEEREEIGKDRPAEWWRSVACILADTLQEVADEFNIFAEYGGGE